jgi:hypothetical protein
MRVIIGVSRVRTHDCKLNGTRIHGIEFALNFFITMIVNLLLSPHNT